MAAVTPQRARLGRQLRALRAAAYPSGLQFASRAGWPQSRVSKLERGAQVPTRADLEHWLELTGHLEDTDLLNELLGQAAAARVDYVADRSVIEEGGFAARQKDRGTAEAATSRITEYQPSMIPGLVQTPAYARELLGNTIGGLAGLDESRHEIDAIVAERIRRQELLYQPGRQVELLIGQAALYNYPGQRRTMLGQLDRLVMLSGIETLRLGIVPFDVPMSVLPLCNFTIHDDELVIIESLSGEQRHGAPDDVKVYLDAVAKLWESAVVEETALALLHEASDRHRLGCH